MIQNPCYTAMNLQSNSRDGDSEDEPEIRYPNASQGAQRSGNNTRAIQNESLIGTTTHLNRYGARDNRRDRDTFSPAINGVYVSDKNTPPFTSLSQGECIANCDKIPDIRQGFTREGSNGRQPNTNESIGELLSKNAIMRKPVDSNNLLSLSQCTSKPEISQLDHAGYYNETSVPGEFHKPRLPPASNSHLHHPSTNGENIGYTGTRQVGKSRARDEHYGNFTTNNEPLSTLIQESAPLTGSVQAPSTATYRPYYGSATQQERHHQPHTPQHEHKPRPKWNEPNFSRNQQHQSSPTHSPNFGQGTNETNQKSQRIVINDTSSAQQLLNLGDLCQVITEAPIRQTRQVHDRRRMTDRANRLATFTDWPKSDVVTPERLAEAGWYFTGPGDRVECPFCCGAVYNWEKPDTAIGEHTKYFPTCPYVRQLYENLSRTELPNPRIRQPSQDTAHEDRLPLESIVLAVEDLGFSKTRIEQAIGELLDKNEEIKTESVIDVLLTLDYNPDNERLRAEIRSTIVEPISDTPLNTQIQQRNPSYNSVDNMPNLGNNFSDAPIPPNSRLSPSASSDLASMEEISKGYEEMQAKVTCKICMDCKIEALFVPCRHLVCCAECANQVRECPLCRARIEGIVKVYL